MNSVKFKLSVLLLYFILLPGKARANILASYDAHFGSMSPARWNSTDADDVPSYRAFQATFQIGYNLDVVSLFGMFGNSRWNDTGALVPVSNPKLQEYYLGGGVSLGDPESLQIHGYIAKSYVHNLKDNIVADGVIAGGGRPNGNKWGFMLTGNRPLHGKHQSGTFVLAMGIGFEQALLSQKTINNGQARFSSIFFVLQMQYIGSGGLEKKFMRLFGL